MNKDFISIISIEEYLLHQKNEASIAHQIYEACTKYGFFIITGHGINPLLIQKLESLSHQFFALPLHQKLNIDMALGGKAWRGYFPLFHEMTDGKPDAKEGLYFGEELDGEHPLVQKNVPLHGNNLFPDEFPEMKFLVLTYIETLKKIAQSIMELIALGLGLDKNIFENHYTKDPLCLFRIFHYPPHLNSIDDEKWGVGAHTDYGMLTLLWQDNSGGLEIFSEQKWREVPVVENALICNIGDMLEKMTQGLFCSTLHRVKNKSHKSRLSFPFFFDPNFSAQIQPLPITLDLLHQKSNASHPRWDGVEFHHFEGTYGQYILSKISKVFPHLI